MGSLAAAIKGAIPQFGGTAGPVPTHSPTSPRGGAKKGKQLLSEAEEAERVITIAAYAATVKSADFDFKELPASRKGGEVCVNHITEGCKLDEKDCPKHHCQKPMICIDFQKKTGCTKGKECNFHHEVIGKRATLALIEYCQKKRKLKGKGKGKDGGGKGGGGKGKEAGKNNKGEKMKPSNKACSNWHSATNPRLCAHGDQCFFVHDVNNPTRCLK